MEKNVGSKITQSMNKRKPLKNIHLKYIDDLSLAEAINLKEKLVVNPVPNPPRPFTFYDRTNHVLPPDACLLQDQLNELQKYCQDNQMVINQKKCKVIMFNPHKKYSFTPELTLSGEGGDKLEVVDNVTLLGVKLRSDMRWCDNSDYICQKGYARLWMMRRLKGLGANQNELLDIYHKQVRSVLELAVPVWQPSITKQEKRQIERVQRCAFNIILGHEYESYSNALGILKSESLEERRVRLCENFAKKSSKHQKYQTWFVPSITEERLKKTRQKNDTKYKPVKSRTERYKNSPLPYLTELLNNME